MNFKICKSRGLFRLKTRNHRADIAIKRASWGRVEGLSIRGSGPNPTNSRTSATPILQRSQFGKFGEFSRILHACKKRKSAKAKPSATALEDRGEYLTPAQLKLRYRCKSNSNFWELVKSQQIPRLVLNQRKILFPIEALHAWEARRTIGSRRGGSALG